VPGFADSEQVSALLTAAQSAVPPCCDDGTQSTVHVLFKHDMVVLLGPAAQVLPVAHVAPGNEPLGKQEFSVAKHELPGRHLEGP
jgi:hypothetical protein